MAKSRDFTPVFDRLCAVLAAHEPALVVSVRDATNYILVTTQPDRHGKPTYFGCVRLGKAYVSYHLFPLYVFPDLLDSISPELHKRMQGKTCFNFKAIDEDLFKELTGLTQRCLDRFRKEGLA